MFLDCPAYLDQQGAVGCGLPAEVRCPAGHYFCAAIESLTWDGKDQHDPDPAGLGFRAWRDGLRRGHDGRHGRGGPTLRDVPAEPEQTDRHPNTAPAYYLGHPARLWITVMRPRRTHTTSPRATQTITGGGEQSLSRQGGPLTGARAEIACSTPATRSWPVTRVQ